MDRVEPLGCSGQAPPGGCDVQEHHYRSKSGRESDWSTIALASQKRYISLYISPAGERGRYLAESYADRLPKADIGRSCVRTKRLSDVDEGALTELIREAAAHAEDMIES